MKVLLAFSVLLNLALAILAFAWHTRSTERAKAFADTVEKTPAQLPPSKPPENLDGIVKADAPADAGAIWRSSKADLLKQLRAWGTPNHIIVEILLAHNRPIVSKKRLEILYPNGVNRWSVRPKTTPDTLAKLDAMYAQGREEIRQLMGPDFDLALADAEPMKRLKWGNLTDEQAAKIKQVSEHYDSLKLKTLGQSPNSTRESFATASLVDSEFATDIRSILPPEQAEEFLTFNSPAALTLQATLGRADVNVDEQTYKKLLQSESEFRKELLSRSSQEHSYETSVREIKMFQSILGTEKALALAVAGMSNFRDMDGVLASSGQDPQTRLSVYYDYMQTTVRYVAAQDLLKSDPVASRAKMAAEGENFYQLMASKLSPQKFEEYRKSRGGQFLDVWRKGG